MRLELMKVRLSEKSSIYLYTCILHLIILLQMLFSETTDICTESSTSVDMPEGQRFFQRMKAWIQHLYASFWKTTLF
jgi:hypothetical protein